MKKISYTLSFLFILVICFSCVENKINLPILNTPPVANGSFKVDIDGETFTTENSEYSLINGAFIISGIKTNTDEVFTLRAENFALGTFAFDGSTGNSAVYIKNDPTSANIWSTINQPQPLGKITITNINTINNTISGIFNFIGKHTNGDAKTFTNGSFTNIPLKVNPVSSNSFFAKIDGIEYAEDAIFVSEISVGGNDLIMINANKSSTGEILSISLPSNISVGEHNFGFVSNPPLGQYTIGGSTYIADGKINITEHNLVNKTITASFEFNASPLISNTPNFSFTEGQFNINY